MDEVAILTPRFRMGYVRDQAITIAGEEYPATPAHCGAPPSFGCEAPNIRILATSVRDRVRPLVGRSYFGTWLYIFKEHHSRCDGGNIRVI